MTPELEKKPLPPAKTPDSIQGMFGKIWHSLRHNLHWKLLALVLAVLMWAGLISQDPTLIREKVFMDVPVTIMGAETLKNNRLIVITDLASAPPTVRMRVDVPQMEYQNVTSATYNPRIDLSRIRETGTQTVKILTTATSAYGSIVDLSPDTIEVEVEEYVTRYRIPVSQTLIGEYPDGYFSDAVNINPTYIAISGPKSIVDRVRRAEVVFDRGSVKTASRRFSTSAPFHLLDENDEIVENQLIAVTSESILIDSVVVDIDLYPTKTLSLSGTGLIKGEPEKGYEVKSVTVTPNTVRVAATNENLELYANENLFVDYAIDLAGKKESFNEAVRIRRPNEIRNLNPDSVTVSVEIGMKSMEREMKNLNVEATDAPQGMSISADIKKASVKITAPELYLEKLKEADIRLIYSLAGLGAGEYDVPIACGIPQLDGIGFTYTIEPMNIHVAIKEK